MALALPLQGLASARMQHCGGASGVGLSFMGATMAAAQADDAMAPVAQDGADAPHHRPAVGHGNDQAQPSASGHTCSACASCCIGLALPPAATVMSLPGHEPAHARVPERAAASFICGGLERPPRADLA